MNYTWKVTGMKGINLPNQPNTIIQTYWTKTGTDEEGNEIPHGDRFTLCGCGKSQKLPFCDGAHKEI